ncbi:hypothetical protein [Streptomyces sp. NPDC058412]|uniref:hypothetical protein n=1 Tax=Streptomyces sp. NPDC058412 TaxID=3346486 RepID=UPI003656390C
MRGLWLVCTAVMAASCLYRLVFWMWAQNPPVRKAREPDGPLTLYEVAALQSGAAHHLRKTLVEGMTISGALERVGHHHLRVPVERKNVDALQAAVLDELEPGALYTGYSLLYGRVSSPEGLDEIARTVREAGLVTRSDSELSRYVLSSVMGIIAVLGLMTGFGTRSFLPFGIAVCLLAPGGAVLLATPERWTGASRRGERMRKAVGSESGTLPALPPGLVLDEEAHRRFARIALYNTGDHPLFTDPYSGYSPPVENSPDIHEGPGLGGF